MPRPSGSTGNRLAQRVARDLRQRARKLDTGGAASHDDEREPGAPGLPGRLVRSAASKAYRILCRIRPGALIDLRLGAHPPATGRCRSKWFWNRSRRSRESYSNAAPSASFSTPAFGSMSDGLAEQDSPCSGSGAAPGGSAPRCRRARAPRSRPGTATAGTSGSSAGRAASRRQAPRAPAQRAAYSPPNPPPTIVTTRWGRRAPSAVALMAASLADGPLASRWRSRRSGAPMAWPASSGSRRATMPDPDHARRPRPTRPRTVRPGPCLAEQIPHGPVSDERDRSSR